MSEFDKLQVQRKIQRHVQDAMDEKSLTLRSFSEIISEHYPPGVTHTTINNWRHGKKIPHERIINYLVQYCSREHWLFWWAVELLELTAEYIHVSYQE